MMKPISEYIYSVNESVSENFTETSNNKERKKALVNALKNKNYSNYVEILNKMLEDDKSRVLLEDGFGGELGDMRLKFRIKSIPIRNLVPTQNEIGVTDSVDFPLKKKPEAVDPMFKEADHLQIQTPLVTFAGRFIIDGHHRWSQVYAFNPDAKMVCCDYDGNISPIEMLKAAQGAIAATLAKRIERDGETPDNKIPIKNAHGVNLFDNKFREEKIREYIEDNTSDELVNRLSHYVEWIKDKDDVADYVTDNLIRLKVNNPPMNGNIKSAQERGVMPQTTKGGTQAGDKQSASHDNEGSALNRLKDPIVKGAIS